MNGGESASGQHDGGPPPQTSLQRPLNQPAKKDLLDHRRRDHNENDQGEPLQRTLGLGHQLDLLGQRSDERRRRYVGYYKREA